MLKLDVHEYEKRLKEDLERLEKNKSVLRKNKELIKKFVDYCFGERISKGRISRYVQCLHKISNWIGRKELDKLNKNDIASLLKRIEEQGFSPWTWKLRKEERL